MFAVVFPVIVSINEASLLISRSCLHIPVFAFFLPQSLPLSTPPLGVVLWGSGCVFCLLLQGGAGISLAVCSCSAERWHSFTRSFIDSLLLFCSVTRCETFLVAADLQLNGDDILMRNYRRDFLGSTCTTGLLSNAHWRFHFSLYTGSTSVCVCVRLKGPECLCLTAEPLEETVCLCWTFSGM